ncbi:MAG TPA: EAL domain-containing protein [Dehalococcoidia bacterium]|nr:EAL domain-containing protein [Dehalococcoidia bacterium]
MTLALPATRPALNLDSLYAAFDQMADTFLVTDRDAKILYVNPAFERVSGYSRAEIVGKHTRILRSGIHAPKVYRELWKSLMAGKPYRFTFTNRKKNGDFYEESALITPMLDVSGQVAYVVAHGRAIEQIARTDRELMQTTLTDLANLDSLTGVPNRRRFQEEVNSSISRGEHGAVLFMDVDDFKAINDSLGHSAGDEFLRSLANCLSECLRHNDVLARLGGDEFAVLLRGATRAETIVVAQRLLKAVREMRSVSSDQPVSSTISIGAALYPAHGASVDELLGHADMAMYRVKRGGRNGLHFYQASHGSKSSSMSRVVWKQKILDALENDCFVLHAQPIIELKTGRLACYELLLRLREPNGTLVHPGKFLPAAEQSGLIHQIDTWVVQQSLTIAHELAMAPRPVNIAFNLSATAVGDADLLELFKREALRLRLDPSRVSIEVTETALISDLPKARAFLNSLKALGFRIALDDFGAGFSSFSRLKQVPADYLKIDGSFIANITRNQEDRHFVRAIANLASGLGIGAVAEYIQDEETMTILRDLGVMYGQGFYIGRPIPLTRILDAHLAA